MTREPAGAGSGPGGIRRPFLPASGSQPGLSRGQGGACEGRQGRTPFVMGKVRGRPEILHSSQAPGDAEAARPGRAGENHCFRSTAASEEVALSPGLGDVNGQPQ